MSKLRSFVKLDFITIKPYFTKKNLLLFAAVIIYMSIVSGTIISGAMIGVMFGTIFMSYPFALGEKGNLDELYATLSLSRKTVVAGRYLFTLVLNLCVVIIVFAFTAIGVTIGSLISESSGHGEITAEALWLLAAVVAIFMVMQSMMLPMYFKLGYTKGKIFNLVPFVALSAGSMAFSSIARSNGGINRIVGFINAMNGEMLGVCAVLALGFVVCVSYLLSLSFYRKREF